MSSGATCGRGRKSTSLAGHLRNDQLEALDADSSRSHFIRLCHFLEQHYRSVPRRSKHVLELCLPLIRTVDAGVLKLSQHSSISRISSHPRRS
ncbi:hypothetical protein PsorP6_009987 [Peronosclerospora sorghi]|uniref:Uncharacterized protein n=1 Tax=Peronosclerospora sorghi TaxID=230839 RepID=A0ACC0VYP8_9STRA|nr:hypothetical protein PsorP6_009987 [Peronosclerospora sorghi]